MISKLPGGGPGSPRRETDRSTFLTEKDLHRFCRSTHCRFYEKMGAHLAQQNDVRGVQFAVWAPNAERVSVFGDFNGWEKRCNPLHKLDESGIWTGFCPGLGKGATYKYHICSRHNGYTADKADPFGIRHEAAPRTASLVWCLDYPWGDAEWMRTRRGGQNVDSPISVYEVHLGSWMRVPEEGNRWLTYRELASRLADYAGRHGFTHVELLPVMKHSMDGWGYQTTCHFAPAGHQGSPQDLMYLIDLLHRRGIGVILDWVPSRFSTDEYGLAFFDGTHLYERDDLHRESPSQVQECVFNYDRPEVRSFLLSNAVFWLDYYHVDGLRLHALASMIYLDYARNPGEWIPNAQGGKENLGALEFLREFNSTVHREFPGVSTYADECTGWPQLTGATGSGGLGFDFKWDRSWTHETLEYFSRDPVERKHCHGRLNARAQYAFTEKFSLPLPHDEVGRAKGSLLGRMPGDDWRKFANLRLLFAYQWAQPGKKLLFMGTEFGQWNGWDHEQSLDWHLVQEGNWHNGLQKLVGQLNWLYRNEPALHEGDCRAAGFEWVDPDDAAQSTLSFLRKSERTGDLVLAVFNFTPVPHHNVRVGAPRNGVWREILNTDALDYGGSGQGNQGGVEAAPFGWHFKSHSLVLTLPPLAALYLRREGRDV